MPAREQILCGDWGTSTFRLMWVDRSSAEILASDETGQGIARMFELWQQSPATDRIAFYLHYIQERIAVLEGRIKVSLKGVPLILSGMASSSIGLEELPYKALPFSTAGSDLLIRIYDNLPAAAREIFLVSGVKSEDHEVMRGEETLLIGSVAGGERSWFIFPGTHSKHIRVSDGRAVELRTFMTGEFFGLLTRHSILAHTVLDDGRFGEGNTAEYFKQGVLEGRRSNLLQSCFRVRTNRLFGVCTDRENYYFLSGLLIGSELSALPRETTAVTLVCGARLRPLYEAALEALKEEGYRFASRYRPAEEALIRGQLRLYALLKKNK